ncbi:hypothetical protein [Bacillus marinisedimentorum]|nr:hypothetical protein [Bacillus marinisedimentorum]
MKCSWYGAKGQSSGVKYANMKEEQIVFFYKISQIRQVSIYTRDFP